MAEPSKQRRKRTKEAQSLSLSTEIIDHLNKESERTGIPKSQLVESLMQEKFKSNEGADNKPTIITVMSFKGGVAKTTTTACLALCLGELGYKVLVIDLDGQGSVSQYLGVYDPRAEEPCIADVMFSASQSQKRKTLDEVTLETQYQNVFIVPSSFRFSGADAKMQSESSAAKDERLCYAIEDMKSKFDYIIIDCPPSLEMTVTNAIIALDAGNSASHLIIPVRIDGFAIAGLAQTIETIERIARDKRSLPKKWRILRTMAEPKTNAYKEGTELINHNFPNADFFKTKITKATIVIESTLAMLPLTVFDPNCKPSVEYHLLAEEIEALNE